MSDLSQLYQQVILDHNKRPRNFHRLPRANHSAEGYNPLCGDHITVDLETEGGVLRDIAFEGAGCAVSKASASMMTEALKGKTQAEADALFETFHALVTGQPAAGSAPGVSGAAAAPLGKLAVFSGVSEFPMRVKCATLAWHTLRAALEGKQEPVSTE